MMMDSSVSLKSTNQNNNTNIKEKDLDSEPNLIIKICQSRKGATSMRADEEEEVKISPAKRVRK
jgi:hypothetical protein